MDSSLWLFDLDDMEQKWHMHDHAIQVLIFSSKESTLENQLKTIAIFIPHRPTDIDVVYVCFHALAFLS